MNNVSFVLFAPHIKYLVWCTPEDKLMATIIIKSHYKIIRKLAPLIRRRERNMQETHPVAGRLNRKSRRKKCISNVSITKLTSHPITLNLIPSFN